MKSAALERQLGKLDEALQTLQEAIAKYPQFDKLHMMRGQILEDRGEVVQARAAYAQGCRLCAKSIPLWILSARLEEKAGVTIKARSLLEKARLYNAKNDELWAESIRIEERGGSTQQAKSILARGKFTLFHNASRGIDANDRTGSNARMPHVTITLVDGNFHGVACPAKGSVRRRHQESRRASGGHCRCGEVVLGREED